MPPKQLPNDDISPLDLGPARHTMPNSSTESAHNGLQDAINSDETQSATSGEKQGSDQTLMPSAPISEQIAPSGQEKR